MSIHDLVTNTSILDSNENPVQLRLAKCLELLDSIDEKVMFELGEFSTPFDRELENLRTMVDELVELEASRSLPRAA